MRRRGRPRRCSRPAYTNTRRPSGRRQQTHRRRSADRSHRTPLVPRFADSAQDSGGRGFPGGEVAHPGLERPGMKNEKCGHEQAGRMHRFGCGRPPINLTAVATILSTTTHLCRQRRHNSTIPSGLSQLPFTETLGLSSCARKKKKCAQSSPLHR